jgi:hypothetical protein
MFSIKDKIDDFMFYLNEFINFDELKQSFAICMRFYAYNQHVYSDSLIKILIICNQQYLTTFKYAHEFIRQAQLNEQEREQFELNSDTNATKNTSTVSSFTTKPINIKAIYDMYANTDTSFIIKEVLGNFENNDPMLNRCCIDFLDSLMNESDKHENLFHMNLALALANITLLDGFRFLDQRTKDLISSMLCEIRCMCKRDPQLANKILFDVHQTTPVNLYQNRLIDEFSSASAKRIKLGKLQQQKKGKSLLPPNNITKNFQK